MMQTRFEILKDIIKTADKTAEINDFSYSAIMRHLRKNNPELVSDFMKSFKRAFDAALNEELPDFEQLALMEAAKSINLKIKTQD